MGHRVGIIFAGVHSDHRIMSPPWDEEEKAMAELRGIRRQRDAGEEIQRSWADVPAGSIIALFVMDDDAS